MSRLRLFGRENRETKKLLNVEGLGGKHKPRINCLSNLESDATTTIDFQLNRLFEQARQSKSKGGNPADPLILNDIKELGKGVSIM